MHSDVNQYETSTTGFTPDSELFTVLPAEAARVTNEEVQLRKSSRSAPPLMLHTQVKGGQIHIPNQREEEECGLHLLLNESFCREQSNPGSVLRSHAHRVSGLLENDETRADVIGKAGRVGGKEPKTLHGKGFYDGIRGRRLESERARPSPARAVFEQISAVGAGSASGPHPENACCSHHDGDGGVERPEVGGVAGCSLRKGCDTTVGHVALLRQGSGEQMCARPLLPER